MKLYQFNYSPYAQKVRGALSLLGLEYETVEVPRGDRHELAELTGGYIQVPVLQDDDGALVTDSRRITRYLDQRFPGRLVPDSQVAAVWAYADWCDTTLENTIFRIGSPAVRAGMRDPWDRALFQFVKERKFGAGCIDDWAAQTQSLITEANELLEPTVSQLRRDPFVLGEQPTLADAALYGELMMLKVADAGLLDRFDGVFSAWMARFELARV